MPRAAAVPPPPRAAAPRAPPPERALAHSRSCREKDPRAGSVDADCRETRRRRLRTRAVPRVGAGTPSSAPRSKVPAAHPEPPRENRLRLVNHRVHVGLPEPGAILNVERRHDGGPQVLLGGIARRPGNTPQRSRQGHRTSSAGARERGCFPREALTARTAWHTGPAASPPPPCAPCLLSHRHSARGCPRILRAFALHLPSPHSSRSPASPLTRDKPLPATAKVLPQPHADMYRSSSLRVKYVRDPSF